jgi:hypothetical protein
MSNSSFLRLTPSLDSSGNLVKENGLIQFRLGLWVNNTELDKLTVNSGAAGVQTLRKFTDPNSLPGSLEPIPEGEYRVGPYEFARANDYAASWGPGLGPVWFDLKPLSQGLRSDFGIHLDANRDYAPGSAGCVVTANLTGLRKIIEWQKAHGFSKLVVDHGLGSVSKPKPVAPAKPSNFPVKIDVNANGFSLTLTEDLKAGTYQLFSNSPSWTGKLVPKE